MIPVVDRKTCNGCEDCVDVCPTECISVTNGVAEIDQRFCEECGECVDECSEEAISLPRT